MLADCCWLATYLLVAFSTEVSTCYNRTLSHKKGSKRKMQGTRKTGTGIESDKVK